MTGITHVPLEQLSLSLSPPPSLSLLSVLACTQPATARRKWNSLRTPTKSWRKRANLLKDWKKKKILPSFQHFHCVSVRITFLFELPFRSCFLWNCSNGTNWNGCGWLSFPGKRNSRQWDMLFDGCPGVSDPTVHSECSAKRRRLHLERVRCLLCRETRYTFVPLFITVDIKTHLESFRGCVSGYLTALSVFFFVFFFF